LSVARRAGLPRRVHVEPTPDPVYVHRSLHELLPMVSAAATRDQLPLGGLRRLIGELRVGLAGPWRQRSQVMRLLVVALLVIAVIVTLLLAGRRTPPPPNGLLIVSIDGDVQAVDPSGLTAPVPFDVAERVTQLTRSPDGTKATLWLGDGDVYRLQLLDLANGARHWFTTDVVVTQTGCIDVWSNDGRWLASGVTAGDRRTIVVTDVGAGTGHAVTPPSLPAECPIWSPDASSIAFVSGDRPNRHAWVMHRDGSGAHDVSADLGDRVASGVNSWSPDGRWLYYDANDPRTERNRIFRTDVDARRSEPVTAADIFAAAPQLSPDGSLLSYITFQGDAVDLWVARADGTQPHRVLHDAESLGWSNDGSVLLARTGDPVAGPNGGIVTVTPDGTQVRLVLAFDAPCDAGRGGQTCMDSVAWGQPRP
jgi:hypothetical protein